MAAYVPSSDYGSTTITKIVPAGSEPAASPAGAASAAPTSDKSDDPSQTVVLAFLLTLSCFILFFFIASIPRLIARSAQPGSWRHGWVLKHRKSVATRARDFVRRSFHMAPAPDPQRRPTVRRGLMAETDLAFAKRMVDRGTAVPPAHVPSWTSIFYPLSNYFRRPFYRTGLSWGQTVMFTLYAVACVCMLFVRTKGTANLKRAGWLVVGQMPVMVTLGSKNSIVGLLVGKGYEKLNYIHRFIGGTMFGATVFHVIGWTVMWLKKDTEAQEAATHVSAWTALAGFLIITSMSLPVIRRSAYNLFYHAHWIGYTTFFIAIAFHVEDGLYWTLASFFLLGLDHVGRLIKSNYTTVTLEAVPELRSTRITIPHLSRGWRAGQHVRLRALSHQMGPFGFAEVHPFTIASVSETTRGEGIVLYVKSAGDWTKKLYDTASNVNPFEEKAGIGNGTTMKMIVEGPYGGPGHALYSSFSSTFMVVGGSGITYGLSVVEELIREIECLRARTRIICLVWVVQDASSILPLLPKLSSFLDRVSYIPTISLRISIHYTRAVSPAFSKTLKARDGLPRGMRVEAGRPDLPGMVEGFVDKTDALSRGKTGLNGVALGVCGPKALAEDVIKAELTIGRERRKSVGGVEVIQEAFSW